MTSRDAIAGLAIPPGTGSPVDPGSRGPATVGEADHHRLTGLDAVRFAAALMVVATHFTIRDIASDAPAWSLWAGNGVSLFFALSGYLLWRPFVDGRPNLMRYAVARAARILPAYWLAVVVLVALRGGDLVGYVVMSPNQSTPLGVLWTLQAEVQFYLVLPLFAMFRRPLLAPLVFGAASLGLELLLAGTGAHGGALESAIPVRLWAFVPGMLLAAWRPRTDWRWLAGGVALMALGAATLPFWGGQWTDIPSAIGAGLLVGWGIGASPRPRWLWTSGAAVSYGLYLWHVDLIELVGPVGLPLAFGVAAVSYLALERPVMRWVSRRRVPAIPVQRLEAPEVAIKPRRDRVGRPSGQGVLADPASIEI